MAGQKYSVEDMLKRLEVLEAENASLKANRVNGGTITVKVTEPHLNAEGKMTKSKGAISLYGLQRFPITLYRNQFQKLADVLADKCKVNYAGSETTFSAFLVAAASKLVEKGE